VEQVSKDFDPETRYLRRREQSGTDSKTKLKRPHELEYEVWRKPPRDLVREAEIEELSHDPVQRKEVRRQKLHKLHRTYNMESSICLQLSPMDLLRPKKLGPLRMQYSVGFMHSCPKRQQKPRDLSDRSNDIFCSIQEHRRAKTAPAAQNALAAGKQNSKESGLGATTPPQTTLVEDGAARLKTR